MNGWKRGKAEDIDHKITRKKTPARQFKPAGVFFAHEIRPGSFIEATVIPVTAHDLFVIIAGFGQGHAVEALKNR